jgi:hypothetical protein
MGELVQLCCIVDSLLRYALAAAPTALPVSGLIRVAANLPESMCLKDLFPSAKVGLDLYVKARWETHRRGHISTGDVAPVV